MAKAEKLCKELDLQTDWTCSSGWLSRWKARHNITYKRISGENASVDKGLCDDWKDEVVIPIS